MLAANTRRGMDLQRGVNRAGGDVSELLIGIFCRFWACEPVPAPLWRSPGNTEPLRRRRPAGPSRTLTNSWNRDQRGAGVWTPARMFVSHRLVCLTQIYRPESCSSAQLEHHLKTWASDSIIEYYELFPLKLKCCRILDTEDRRHSIEDTVSSV